MKRNLTQMIKNRIQQLKVEFTCILIILFLSGSAIVMGQEIGSTLTNDKVDGLSKSELTGENLTPYQPSSFDNKIVISSVTGTYTSTSPLFNTQTIYVDWAITNNGSAAITTTFYTKLYLDGVLKGTWSTPGLAVGAWAYVLDSNIGILSSGAHSLRIETDATGVVTETNETDNSYTRYITVYPYVNFTTYQPAAWDNKIVLSTVSGTSTSDAQIFDTDNIYLDWSVANVSSQSTTTTFYIDLYIDNVWKAAWSRSGLGAFAVTSQSDYSVGKLAAGSHTFKIRIDGDGYVPEYNETDNEYSRTITVYNKNLLFYQPSGWDNKLVLSTVTATNTSASAIYNNQDIYVDWAVRNNGSAAITETFHTKLFIDGTLEKTWFTSGLASNSWAYIVDHNIGKLAIGWHTIQIVTDSNAEVTETNEADNSYSKTFYVGPSYNLTPYQIAGWDDKIVLSTVTGTNTSASLFFDTDNIYVDWGAINNALNDFTTTFYIRLYIDGVFKSAWTKAGLNHNTYTFAIDYNAGKLPAGDHTFKIVVDSDHHIAESDETDNEYSRTITVKNKNLTTYKPSGWDNKIVLSTVTGTNTSASDICEPQHIYVDYAIYNNGTAVISETFYVRLSLDGVVKATWTHTGLAANTYYTIQDFALGTLPAGDHTIRIVADVLDNVNETNEADNEYTRTFTVSTCKNLTPNQPAGWDNKIVISTVTGTNISSATVYSDQIIYLDWSVISNGTVNITETFNIKLYLDGNLKNSWSKAGLAAGSYLYAPDYNMGILPAGPHTFKIVADADNSVPETNEADNEYSRTITVIQRSLNVSSATVLIGNESGSNGTFSITSNTSWTITDDADWLSVSPASGSDNATITVTASSKNATTTARTAKVTIVGAGVSNKTVSVTQEGLPTGINDTENDKIRIYPNPVTGTLFIEGLTQITIVSIYNLHGNLLLKKEFTDNKIDVSNLPTGIYIIEFKDYSGTVTREFIKN